MSISFIVPILIFIVALLYASVGHGGASGYLAIMALIGVAPVEMRASALVLNLLVSVLAFLQFHRAVVWNRKLFACLTIPSVFMAYCGSRLPIEDGLYRKLLGAILIIPILKMLVAERKENKIKDEFNMALALLIGAVVGLISGMIGIGGGILLSPVLIMLGWSSMKQTAAISALFISANSLAGLIGQLQSGFQFNDQIIYWTIAALLGGALGGYWGAAKWRDKALRIILAMVLLLAALKLMLTAR